MPRFLYLPLRMLALLGAIASLIVGVFTIPPISPLFQSGGGIPGYQGTLWKLLLYTTVITSGVESLLLAWLSYCQVIPRRWGIIGVCLFGTIFLITVITIFQFFGSSLKYGL